jgi:hypothetical protein
VIRTQELIEARKIDGGEQFFQEQMILILKNPKDLANLG